MWTHTKESQAKITPGEALEYLKDGNDRFMRNLNVQRDLLKQVNQTSAGQFPFATILSCIDSRTSAELIFDQGLGDVFSIRIAGNVLNDDILGSMEFACAMANSKIVVVLGHTKCGAVAGACDGIEDGHITNLLAKIKPAIELEQSETNDRTGDNSDFVAKVAFHNVHLVIDQVRNKSKMLADMEKNGQIMIVGGMYNIETGRVEFFE